MILFEFTFFLLQNFDYNWNIQKSVYHPFFLSFLMPHSQTKPLILEGPKKGVKSKAPIKIGGEQRMKESYNEGVASHIDPESCLDVPRGRGEALTGESAGGLLSGGTTFSRRPSQWFGAKAKQGLAICEWCRAPAESENLVCVDTLHARIGRPRKGNCVCQPIDPPCYNTNNS